MRQNNTLLLVFLPLLILAASCRNIRKITDRDQSVAVTGKTVRKSGNKPRFLEGIQTSGSRVEPDARNVRKIQGIPARINLPSPAPPRIENTFFSTNVNLDEVDALQIKYAIRADIPVERLLNLPLYKQVDMWWGTRYCLGGNSTACIDCSGFTTAIMRDVYNVLLPRTSQEQYNKANRIEMAQLREGDLVFFSSGGGISHVGIYLINNKFVHASTSQGVMISDLNDSYWQPKYYGAGRYSSGSAVR